MSKLPEARKGKLLLLARLLQEELGKLHFVAVILLFLNVNVLMDHRLNIKPFTRHQVTIYLINLLS